MGFQTFAITTDENSTKQTNVTIMCLYVLKFFRYFCCLLTNTVTENFENCWLYLFSVHTFLFGDCTIILISFNGSYRFLEFFFFFCCCCPPPLPHPRIVSPKLQFELLLTKAFIVVFFVAAWSSNNSVFCPCPEVQLELMPTKDVPVYLGFQASGWLFWLFAQQLLFNVRFAGIGMVILAICTAAVV